MKFVPALRFWRPRRFAVAADDALVITKDRFGPDDAERSLAVLTLLGMASHALLLGAFGRIESPTDVWVLRVLPWVYLGAATGAGAWVIRTWRRSLGQWRVDAVGIAFFPRFGPPRRLAWGEVARVRWDRRPIRLVGAADRLQLVRGGLPDDAWDQVLDRIKAGLAPRFDLSSKSFAADAAVPISLERVLTLASPAGLVIVAAIWAATRMPERWMKPTAGAGLLVVAGYLALLATPIIRRERRRAWREPRPLPGDKPAADPELA